MVLKVAKYKVAEFFICFYCSSDLCPLGGSVVCGALNPLHVMLSEGARRPSVMCVGVPLAKARFLLWFYEGAYGSSVLTAFWDLFAQRFLRL